MALLSRMLAPDLFLPDGLRRQVRRRFSELAGSLLLVAAGMLAVALSTWSINDPSLNHAVRTPPQNMLGLSGAVLSDLAMQVFGLASALAVFVLARWGWTALTHQEIARKRRRVVAGLAGLITGSAFAATLPVPTTWPLPTGLGGFLGDRLLAIPFAIFSTSPGLVAISSSFAIRANAFLPPSW